MWYMTNKNQQMDARCFNQLNLLLKSIIENDEKEVVRYINESMDPDSTIIYDFTVPYIGDHISLGELTVAWAKFSNKWDMLIREIVDTLEEEVLDYFEDMRINNEEQVLYVGNYIIMHD